MNRASSSSARLWRERASCRNSRIALNAALAGGGAECVLHTIQRQFDAHRDVGEQLVGPFDLCRRERRGARRIAANRVEMTEQRLDVALDLLREGVDAAREPDGSDDYADLHDRDGERRPRDDAEKEIRPGAHALSRVLAC